MCGILAILGLPQSGAATTRERAVQLQKKIRHRGPDWSGIYTSKRAIFCHERLAIVDPESGDQPLYAREDKSLVLAVNGEIYNHKELLKSEQLDETALKTGSDCEPLLLLYEKYGKDLFKKVQVNGMYGVVILDERTGDFIIARDPVGIIPLYYGHSEDGSFWVSSEMKTLCEDCVSYQVFPPGHVYCSKTQTFEPFLESAAEGEVKSNWWVTDDKKIETYPKAHFDKKVEVSEVRENFEKAVKSHLMSDVPYGVLLSGGLDSSLVASIMARHCKKRQESNFEEDAFYPRLHSFCIGLEGSPDLKAAKQVADFLGTVHHGYTFTPEQGVDALRDVIYHIESFDVTTIRSSTPMYLMTRKIRSTGVKMVMSGEGADEIFGGYLYFHKAPNAQEFHEETVRKCRQLNKYDCLRANKSTMAWSVEARVPFLDREFMEFAFSFDPTQKMCKDEVSGKKRCEKYLLRKAFDVEEEVVVKDSTTGETKTEKRPAYLPKEVLWRQKEQFSDGVGYNWIDEVQRYAETKVTDDQLAQAKFRFPSKTPKTKEAYLYREIFESHFGGNKQTQRSLPSALGTVEWQDSIACSSETALKWDAAFQGRADASGRAVAGVHEDAYSEAWKAEPEEAAEKVEKVEKVEEKKPEASTSASSEDDDEPPAKKAKTD